MTLHKTLLYVAILVAIATFIHTLYLSHVPPAHMLANYNSTAICQDAWQHDLNYTNLEADHFEVELHEGCFSGIVSLPRRFQTYWKNPVKPDAQWWFSIWFVGDNPRGPFGPNNIPVFDYAPTQFRLQGHGRILFYTNDPSRQRPR